MDNKYKLVLEKIPEILSSNEDINQNFEKVITETQNVVDFDNAYICYLNAGCANIQYRKSLKKEQPINPKEQIIKFPEILKTKLYDNTLIEFDENSGFFNALEFQKTNSNYILVKLNIKNTVFGFLLISRNKQYKFTKEEREILTALSDLISYSIKDSDLSSVFKLQLRALQDSIL